MNAITEIIPAVITAPGIYNMPSGQYHDDPCDTPSLSAGMINQLLDAPAKCFHNSKRLNPNYEAPEDSGKFTIGTVSHVIHLEPEVFANAVVVVEADDWRTKAAKDARAKAKDAGKTAVLPHQLAEVEAARAAFVANPFTRAAFSNGRTEQSLFWRHPIYGFWCRCRPDFLADSRAHTCDYKATANANPAQFGRHAYNMGYHRRAAWYLEGIAAIFGKRPEHYWFCNQEPKAPYLTSIVELDWAALEAGQDENDHAAGIFASCLATGDWYGYREHGAVADRAFRVAMPAYAYMDIDQRLGRAGREWPTKRVEQTEYEGVE